MATTMCKICGKKRYIRPSDLKKGYGQYCSKKCKGKDMEGKTFEEQFGEKKAKKLKGILSKQKLGLNNPQWKGDNVSYKSLHEWIRKHKPKPKLCEKCGKEEPYDVANKSGEYQRNIDDYDWLCRKCHMIDDGRYFNWQWHKQKIRRYKHTSVEIFIYFRR